MTTSKWEKRKSRPRNQVGTSVPRSFLGPSPTLVPNGSRRAVLGRGSVGVDGSSRLVRVGASGVDRGARRGTGAGDRQQAGRGLVAGIGHNDFGFGRKDQRKQSQRQDTRTSSTGLPLHRVRHTPTFPRQLLCIPLIGVGTAIGPNHRVLGHKDSPVNWEATHCHDSSTPSMCANQLHSGGA